MRHSPRPRAASTRYAPHEVDDEGAKQDQRDRFWRVEEWGVRLLRHEVVPVSLGATVIL